MYTTACQMEGTMPSNKTGLAESTAQLMRGPCKVVYCFERAVSNSMPLTPRRRASVGGEPPALRYPQGLCLPGAWPKTHHATVSSAQLKFASARDISSRTVGFNVASTVVAIGEAFR